MALDRTTLPEEFFDVTGAQLLVQPEPQYLYCSLLKAALAIELSVPDMIGLPGREAPNAGAPYSAADRDRLMLASGIPEAVFQVKHDFSKGPGHTMRYNRPQFANTTYTEASRQVKAGSTISTTPIEVGSEQNTLTLKRFAGPYDSTNSRVAPYAIESFDANMGVHQLSKIAGTHLKRDFDRFLDSWSVATLDVPSTSVVTSGASINTVYPEGMTADNDATAAGQFPMTYEQTSRTSKEMDDLNLPTLPDGRRILVVTPTGKKQLKDDPQFAEYVEKHASLNPLASPTWFGSTPEFHCFVNNTLTVTSNGSSVNIHKGHAIAPGVLAAGVGRPPTVRTASDDNYGETPKVIWLADLAQKCADERFVLSVRYSQD